MAKSCNKCNKTRIHLKALLATRTSKYTWKIVHMYVRQMVYSACKLNVLHMASRTSSSTALKSGREVMLCLFSKLPLIFVYVYFSHIALYSLFVCLFPQLNHKILKSMNLAS